MAVNKIIKGAPGKVLHTCGQWLLSTPYITLDGSTIQPTFTPAACDDIRPLTSGAVHYAVEHAQEIRWDDDPKAVIVRQRAAKDDDAEIPFAIWDTPFWEQLLHWGQQTILLTVPPDPTSGDTQNPHPGCLTRLDTTSLAPVSIPQLPTLHVRKVREAVASEG